MVIFWHALGGLVATTIYIAIEYFMKKEKSLRLANYTERQYLIASVASIFYMGSFFGSQVAFQVDSSSFIALLSYLTIVYAYVVDQIYFNEKLRAVEFVASLIILVVAFGVACYKIMNKSSDNM